VVGTKNRGTSVYNRMASLLNCESEREYYQLCELLIGRYFIVEGLWLSIANVANDQSQRMKRIRKCRHGLCTNRTQS
jgi:hypothetical protein